MLSQRCWSRTSNRDGGWKYTKSFDADSLGKVVSLCQQAQEAINGLQQHDAAK